MDIYASEFWRHKEEFVAVRVTYGLFNDVVNGRLLRVSNRRMSNYWWTRKRANNGIIQCNLYLTGVSTA
jgi:hypothetical protein